MTKIGKIPKYVEINQHVTEQPLGQRRINGKSKNTLRQKWKYNIPKVTGCRKVVLKGKFIAINVCFKKQK